MTAVRTQPSGTGVSFTVPGRPVPHSLNKRYGKNGFVGFYLPPECAAYKEAVALFARRACRAPLEGPVGLTVRAYAVPMGKGRMPDLTNVIKLVEDAVKGICFGDDRWTRHSEGWLRAVDTQAEERVEVRVRRLAEGEWPDD